MVPVANIDELTLFWTLPYPVENANRQPLKYFQYLFGHEGENSILSYLKSQGLAVGISAGATHELWGFSIFDVTITLTAKGLNEYQKVVQAVFQHAKRLRDKGPQEFIFKECNAIGNMKFNYEQSASPLDLCLQLSKTMQSIFSD